MSRVSDASHLIRLLTNGQILGLDALTNLMTGGGAAGEQETIYTHKASRVDGADAVAHTASKLVSFWKMEGTPLPHGANPGAFSIPNSTTVGGLQQANPSGGRKKYIQSVTACVPQGGALILCDRLLHCSGLNADVSPTGQDINGGASADVTRYTDGVGNWLCVEIYTIIGVGSRTITATYKDGAGATKTTPNNVFGATSRREVQTLIPLSLAAGGSTVKGCTNVSISGGGTGSAGDFGISIIHPLLMITMGQGASANPVTVNFAGGPMPEVLTDACLFWVWVSSAAIAPVFDAFVTFVEV